MQEVSGKVDVEHFVLRTGEFLPTPTQRTMEREARNSIWM
jgi:hypothetical protein